VNFDLWDLAVAAIRESKTMTGIYDLIEQSVLDRLVPIVKRAKIADPIQYAKWLAGIPIISVAFASFEDGNPRVVTVAFHIDVHGLIVKPERQDMGGSTAQLEDMFLGTNKQMVAATDKNNVASWGPRFVNSPVNFTEGLIQLEIDAATRDHRGDVGPPITILGITKSGGAFMEGHKGACTQR
jgi:hypothetical protein